MRPVIDKRGFWTLPEKQPRPDDLLEKVSALRDEAGWLLTRAQLTLDELDAVLRTSPPRLVEVDAGSEVEVSCEPVRWIRIFIEEFPGRLRVFSAPAYAKEVSYSRTRDHWYSLVGGALARAGEKRLPRFESALVVFTFLYRAGRLRDPDRYAAKFILDALCHHGIIADDTLENVILVFAGKNNQEKHGTEILIADLFTDFHTYLSGRLGG